MNPFTRTKQAAYDFCSTHFDFRPSDRVQFQRVADSIEDRDVYKPYDAQFGREQESHVTVLYGITRFNPHKIAELVAHWRPVRVKLGKISRFENKKAGYDVLKVEVKGTHLHQMHNKLRNNVSNEYHFDSYNPHITLAYVKPGRRKDLDGDTRFEDKEYTFDQLTCTKRRGRPVRVQLTGAPATNNPYIKKAFA